MEEKKKGRGRPKKSESEKLLQKQENKKKQRSKKKSSVKYFSKSNTKLETSVPEKQNILHLDIKSELKNEDSENLFSESEKMNKEVDDILEYRNNCERSPEHLLDETDRKEIIQLRQSIKELNLEGDLEELMKDRIEQRQNQDKILVKNFNLETNYTQEDLNKKNVKFVDYDEEESEFYRILKSFVVDDWPKKTDISCWWCCHRFKNVPIGMPIKYNIEKRKFLVHGVYCSFSCMVSDFFNRNLKGIQYKETLQLIRYFYVLLTGNKISVNELPRASPRETLKMFGGNLDIEEFRGMFEEGVIYKMIGYPMYITRTYIKKDSIDLKKKNEKIFTIEKETDKIILAPSIKKRDDKK